MQWRFPAHDQLISGVAGECSWCHCGLAQAGLTRVRLVSLMPGHGLRDRAALRGSSGVGLPSAWLGAASASAGSSIRSDYALAFHA